VAKAVKNSGRPGQELRYDVTITNINTLCGPQVFQLQPVKKPKNWTATVSQVAKKTVTLLPGQSKRFIVRLKAPLRFRYQKYPSNLKPGRLAASALKKITNLKPTIKYR